MREAVTTGAETEVVPFLKWAGGKRWLSARELLQDRLNNRRTYFEPFLGSAAMFFNCRPARAVLSDTNAELIETYLAIKSDHKRVVSYLREHARHHDEPYYYKVRSSSPRQIFTRAARFIYLNRTCWNGLYRVNREGVFNVPKGSKSSVFLETDDFRSVASSLAKAKILCSDFEAQINLSKEGDVVFADPPYTVRHNLNGFVKYNEKLFSWDDQVRLRDALVRASNRGVSVLVTNANHSSIREIYKSNFHIHTTERFSAISSLSESRGKFSELIITNWRL